MNTLTKGSSSRKRFLDDLTWQRFSLGHMWTFLGDRFLIGVIKPEIIPALKKVKIRAFKTVWVTISSRWAWVTKQEPVLRWRYILCPKCSDSSVGQYSILEYRKPSIFGQYSLPLSLNTDMGGKPLSRVENQRNIWSCKIYRTIFLYLKRQKSNSGVLNQKYSKCTENCTSALSITIPSFIGTCWPQFSPQN